MRTELSDDPVANYLKPGDVVEVEIEKLGILRNPTVAEVRNRVVNFLRDW